MQDEVILTSAGYKDLEEKLHELKTKRRQEVSEKIKIAREFGDISENAEYDAAKDEQAAVEGEILEIEAKLRTAKIIDDVIDTRVVTLGCTVVLENLETNQVKEYQIVGTTEADPFKGRISNESPVGHAVLGQHKNEKVTVYTPNGKEIEMRIIDIKR